MDESGSGLLYGITESIMILPSAGVHLTLKNVSKESSIAPFGVKNG
jgi:hypothetical protein